MLVLTVLVTFVAAGFWQLERHEQVRTHNAEVRAQLAAPSVTLGEALADGEAFRRVEATGRYLADSQLLSTPRSRDGSPGHHVLTPLRSDEVTVLVDRGWVPFERAEGPPDELVAPPEGEVGVAGLLMPAEEGDPGQGEQLRIIDPAVVSERAGVAMADAYLLLQDGDGVGDQGAPLPGRDPVLEEGNHLSYAVQWFVFTGVVVVGYPLLARSTAHGRRPAPPASAPADGQEPFDSDEDLTMPPSRPVT